MGLQTHVTRRGGVFLFRVRIPRDLIEHLLRRELRRSLRTGNAALARRRGARLTAVAHGLFETVRRETGMDEMQRSAIIKAFYEARLDDDLEMRETFGAGRDGAGGSARPITNWPQMRMLLADQLAQGDYSAVEAAATEALTKAGLPLGPQPIRQVGHGLLRAWIEAIDRGAERDLGLFHGTPRDPLVAAALALPQAPPVTVVVNVQGGVVSEPKNELDPVRSRLPLSQHVDTFLTEKTSGKNPLGSKTEWDYRASAALFDKINEDVPIGEILAFHVVKYKDTLLALPANFRKIFKTDNPMEAIDLNKALATPRPTLDPVTINNKYLSNIREMLKWGRANRLVAGEPAKDVSVCVANGPRADEERLPFTASQLTRIFHAPLFTGCKSSARLHDPGLHHERGDRFWTPILAVLHGARLNELGQLDVDDVRLVNEVWCLSIASVPDPGDHNDDSTQNRLPTKRGKTPAARRLLPLHDEILRLGFLDYWADIKRAGHKRLFPQWNIGADRYYSSAASKFYNERFLKNAGVKSDKTCFYSFRHCFKNGLRGTDMKSEMENYLMGHADGSVAARYGSKDAFLLLAEKSQKLLIPGLDLSHIKPYRNVVRR